MALNAREGLQMLEAARRHPDQVGRQVKERDANTHMRLKLSVSSVYSGQQGQVV